MKYLNGSKKEIKIDGPTAITLGKFDGLHRGHRKLIEKIKKQKKNGLATVVFTFDISPKSLLYHEKMQVLTTSEERAGLLEELGVEYLVEYPFDSQTARMEPEDFIKNILCGQLGAKYIAVGEDFHFGFRRRGDRRLLEELSDEYSYQLEVLKKEKYEDREISSSWIKEALKAGELDTANQLLGYDYRISGKVEEGRQLGRTVGIPTANLVPPWYKLLPPNGVYVTKSKVEGVEYPGISNIGYKPTVKASFKGVETYLFDFSEDIYSKVIEVSFCHFKREEKKFPSWEELHKQMKADIAFGKEYFNE